MKKLSLLFIFSVTLNCFAFAQNDGTINLKKGEKFILENKVVTNITQEMMGQSIEVKNEMHLFYSIDVKEIKGNVYTISINNNRITTSANAMGQDLSFDSDKKEDMDGKSGSSYKSINVPHDVFMDRYGKIIVDEKEDSTVKEDDSQNPFLQMMKQMNTSPEKGGYGLLQAFKALPKNVKTGYSWKDSITSDIAKSFITYTIAETKNGEVTINSSGIINTDVKQQVQGVEITGKLFGTLTGTETVNILNGVIKESNSTVDSKGIMSVMGQEVPVNSKIVSTTTVKPL